jgi:hypothetical protein
MELSNATTQDLVAELSRRGYIVNLNSEFCESSLAQGVNTAVNQITWDNWEEEDGTHSKLGDVYFCKLDWIKEYMLGSKLTTYEEGYDEELDEKLDIINDLQETICPILNLLDNE